MRGADGERRETQIRGYRVELRSVQLLGSKRRGGGGDRETGSAWKHAAAWES